MSFRFALVGISLLSLTAENAFSPVLAASIRVTAPTMVAVAANRSGAVIADAIAAAPCHSARVSYKAAKAAATAAANENALRLFQGAIEQFELCRGNESAGSTSELTDEAFELDAELTASGYFIDTDSSHAVTLLISAMPLLSSLCFQKSLPASVREFLWADVKIFRVFAPRLGLEGWGACPSEHMPAPTPTPQ
jgi:hypothetical protein